MKKGIWKKYEKTEIKAWNERASYDDLYDDLRNSGNNWGIALDYGECRDQLAGELIASDGTKSGDIYVYYINDDERMVPEFYIKISEFKDMITKEKRNHIMFNECSLGYDGIDNKYLPELITKLREIDEIKNRYYIEKLEIRYKNYQRLLSLQIKDSFTDDELLFLYYMAYVKNDNVAISMIKDRDIQKDFDSFSDENKVQLFLHVKNSPMSNKLSIDSKDILMTLAQNRCLKQLNNTTEDIINDKKYVMSLLECFFEADKSSLHNTELILYLPLKYRLDIDILELIFYKYTTSIGLAIAKWIETGLNSKKIVVNPEFAYRLIDSFSRALINREQSYYENGLLWVLSDEILKDIENHILIGPEPTEQRENLKNESIKVLKREKEKILNYRRENKE